MATYLGRAYLVPSETTPGTEYLIIVGSDWNSCTCPAYYSNPSTLCKHLTKHYVDFGMASLRECHAKS